MRYLQRFIFAHFILIMIIGGLNSKAHAQAPQCQELSHNSCSVLPSSTYKAFCKFPHGAVYEGDMDCSGYLTGQGKIRNADGSTYAGSWRQGYYHGFGVYEASGEVYRGEFFQGAFTGKGQITLPDGSLLSGQFVNGFLDGVGEAKWGNGDYSQGRFKKGKLNGKGVLEVGNQKSVGTFKDGFLVKGVMEAGNQKLVGTFKDGFLVSGNLKTKSAEYVEEREGDFRNGQLHGKGIVRNFDNSGNLIMTTTGNYIDGFLEGAFHSENYEAGKLLFSTTGSSKKGVPYGSIKQNYADGSTNFVELLGGVATKPQAT